MSDLESLILTKLGEHESGGIRATCPCGWRATTVEGSVMQHQAHLASVLTEAVMEAFWQAHADAWPAGGDDPRGLERLSDPSEGE